MSDTSKKVGKTAKYLVESSKPYVMKSTAVLSKLVEKIADCLAKEAADIKKGWEGK